MRAILCLAFCVSAVAYDADGLAQILQEVSDMEAQKYDCAIAIGLKTEKDSISVASGNSDETVGKEIKAKPTDRFVWGSITKVITGTALLRLNEKGALDLDASASEIIDPLLAKMKKNTSIEMNFTKLSDLWGPETDSITIRQLATMESGIPDFDTARPSMGKPTDSFRATVLDNPSEDFGPVKLISFPWVATGSLKFTPGSKFDYSSTNFVLLGLAICAATPGCNSWDQYNQKTVFTDEVSNRMRQGVEFGDHGDPSDYSQVHGYDRTPYNGHNSSVRPGADFWKVHGAFSGWTASDVCMSVGDAVEVAHAVYSPGGGLLNNESQYLMQHKDPNSHSFYTFATMDLGFQTGQCTTSGHSENCSSPYAVAWGHLGAT
jgi:CubicO group peptidase (beta-lactamase class C family)